MLSNIWNKPLALKIRNFCIHFGVVELSIFGSSLRDDFRSDSDVDVLIVLEQDRRMTLELYDQMRNALSDIFDGRAIDLVQKRLLTNPFRRQEILDTREILYAA